MFDLEFARESLPYLIRGAWVTVYATCTAFALALLGGLALAVLARSRLAVVRGLVRAYVEVVRNTPFLIQLFILFYILPTYGITLPAVLTGIIALGLNFSPYLAEVYRSGIDAVPRGQWDAAAALNLPTRVTWRRITLPYAAPPLVPEFGSYLIAMFKESSLLATISVVELVNAARNVGGVSYKYLEPFTLVALIYLVICIPVSLLVGRLEARLDVRT